MNPLQKLNQYTIVKKDDYEAKNTIIKELHKHLNTETKINTNLVKDLECVK